MKALYIAYFTGKAGSNIGLFYIADSILAGADAGGMKYDGVLQQGQDGTWRGAVDFIVPPDTPLISGLRSGSEPMRMAVQVTLPKDFDNGQVVRIDTPGGPVNVKFEKIRDLP